MSNTNSEIERRKHKRYQTPADSFVTLGSYHTALGQIIDISMGGLGFRYMGSERSKESYLDIFACDFALANIPLITISDFEIDNTVLCNKVDPIHPSCRTMRRSGIQFGELTPDQKAQLKRFIWDHGHGHDTFIPYARLDTQSQRMVLDETSKCEQYRSHA